MSKAVEYVDILTPPAFEKSGVVKQKDEAIKNEDWIGTFTLWILQSSPTPAIIYQQRNPDKLWEPGKLDLTVGGHYQAGETIFGGLREVKEELGKVYKENELTYLGRRLYVGPDTNKHVRHNVVDIFFATDNSPLPSYILQTEEVFALVICPIQKLLEVHTKKTSFIAHGLNNKGEKISIPVSIDSFPYNWDNYHFKIAQLANRYLKGEKNIIY